MCSSIRSRIESTPYLYIYTSVVAWGVLVMRRVATKLVFLFSSPLRLPLRVYSLKLHRQRSQRQAKPQSGSSKAEDFFADLLEESRGVICEPNPSEEIVQFKTIFLLLGLRSKVLPLQVLFGEGLNDAAGCVASQFGVRGSVVLWMLVCGGVNRCVQPQEVKVDLQVNPTPFSH